MDIPHFFLQVLQFLSFRLVKQVAAQVRESSEVMLAPALEVFAGKGTGEENLYIAIIVILGGLVVALAWLWLTYGLQKATWEIGKKVFTVWLLMACSVSILTAVRFNMQKTRLETRADIQARPEQVVASYENEVLELSWQTYKPTLGAVKFFTTDGTRVVLSNRGVLSRQHQVEFMTDSVSELSFIIISDGVEYGYRGDMLEVE